MIVADYEKLFKPFQRDGASLEDVISWLKKTTNAEQDIIDLVISETMGMASQGFDFTGNCSCGCSFDPKKYPDAKISHYMLSRVFILKAKIDKSKVKILQEVENTKLEARQKQLSTFEKDYYVMLHGRWYKRFWKWLTIYKGIK